MSIFRRKRTADLIDLHMIDTIANMKIEDAEPGILNRSANAIDSILDDARGERERLHREIIDRQERLRQTNVVIQSFESAQRHLEAGADEPDRSEVKKRGRRPELVAAE